MPSLIVDCQKTRIDQEMAAARASEDVNEVEQRCRRALEVHSEIKQHLDEMNRLAQGWVFVSK